MKKIWRMVAGALSLSIGLTGCGGAVQKNSETSTDTTVTKEKTAESSSNTKEPVKLKFTYWGSPDEKKAIEECMQKFTENNPNITVEPIQIPNGDYVTKLTAMSAADDMPDLGYMPNELGDTWSQEDKFVNLFEMLDKDDELKREDFLDHIWFKSSPDTAWGMSSAGECFGLYYNKDILAENGIESSPSKVEDALTWDEFLELAKKLTLDKNGKNAADPDFDANNIKQYGIMFETWDAALTNFIASNGGEWLSADGKKFAMNSPEAAEAIQRLSDLINVYHVAPSPLAAKSLPGLQVALQSKVTAMIIGGQWINLDLGNAKANYDIGVLPKMKKSITVALSGASVVFKESKHPEEAWLLFKWMSNPDGAIGLYSGGLWMPTLKKWYTEPELIAKWVDANPAAHPAGFKDAMMGQILNNAVLQPGYYIKNQAKVISTVVSGLDPVWMGKMSAADALKQIETQVQPEIQGRYDVE